MSVKGLFWRKGPYPAWRPIISLAGGERGTPFRPPVGGDVRRRGAAGGKQPPVLLFFFVLVLSGALWAEPALMPMPAKVTWTGESVPIGGGVQFRRIDGSRSDLFLEQAEARFERNLARRNGLLEFEEDYVLRVSKAEIGLVASSRLGVLRGLATLLQLVELTPQGFTFAGADIQDQPRFSYRGLLIDPARHVISLATIKRQIDAMEFTKLNVLHLHLSDHGAGGSRASCSPS